MGAGARYLMLGPLAVTRDGASLALGGPRQRALLAILLAQAGTAVSMGTLVDSVWGADPPETAENAVQGHISALRKVLGREAIVTLGRGYAVIAPDDALDVRRFERLVEAGAQAARDGRPEEAAAGLRAALELWRGPALADLADEPAVRTIAARLEELRVTALESRLEADLACGRDAELVAELDALVAEHPLRERLRALQMLALYRAGRQADALAAYRGARTALVEELGIEPGAPLRDLQRAILAQDPALNPARGAPSAAPAQRRIMAGALEPAALEALAGFVAPLGAGGHEVLLAATAPGADTLAATSQLVRAAQRLLEAQGLTARAAAFTSVTPGGDLARLAEEQDAELLVVDAPAGLLEDARLLSVLDAAPCDVAVAVGTRSPGPGPVLVPFSGAEHDWAAVELGAWLARGSGAALELAGASTGPQGRDASRLLANASLAVQRALGVAAEPLLVEPAPQAVLEVAGRAGIVVVGLTERWRSEGLGATRTALAARPQAAVLLVRRGLRPGGLAPRGGATRFTWTLAP
ncbi:MAG TPA: AfsR/SARP family transcriptional regulator [Solirubrobacteraceae bacterium]|nr:AfsR/SARP family transcriptional regulator [Solirubrobacteraceae bacterium]